MTVRSAHEWDPPVTEETPVDRAEQELAERVGDDFKHLIEVMRFGQETEQFINSNPVGRFLVTRAEEDLNSAVKELLDLDSLKGKTARTAFEKAKVAVKVLRWIDETITAGKDSELAITGLDATEG